MNPFGTGNPRFEYQKQTKKSELSTDMNNGMISVKDKEVMEKRMAFQKTIELHKKFQDMAPNAIFKSQVDRECQPSRDMSKMLGSQHDFNKSAYASGATMRTTMKTGGMYTTVNSSTMHDKSSSLGLFNEN